MKNSLTMLASVGHGQMNSFIITTADNKVILIDGGYRTDAEKLLSELKRITGSETPHIDAWFLSHPHLDHIGAFNEIIENHFDEISFESIYFSFPSVQFVEKTEPKERKDIADFYADLPKFADRICVVTEGDTYEVGGARFDILYSPDPSFKKNAVNNAGIVFRMTLGGKTFMFLGDAGVEAGEKLLKLHGNSLKSDYCQMAHHGQNGVDRPVYEAICPDVCLWCTPLWLWNNDAGKGYNTHSWKTVIVRGWMDEIGVKEHYVAKDGDAFIEL